MTELGTNNKEPSSSINRNKMWLMIGGGMLLLALMFVGGLFLNEKQRVNDQIVLAYEGGSGHWSHAEIPVSRQCAACHEQEFKEWAESDHAWAFRLLDSKWDSKAFQHQRLKAHGSELTFFTDRDGTRIAYDSESGKNWTIKWATGRVPLVQYLVPSEDGGYHTLSASWDVARDEWFDIFEGDERTSKDWGHWRGRGMNWNSQCAWCHMTHFKKNYDTEQDRYASTWTEPGVTCLQCHGPLLDHPEADTGCMIASRNKLTSRQIHDNCASCHARRGEMDDSFKAGDRFDDHFVLVLPVQPGIFWPNGMQRDEDYCETGMRLSRMGMAGVTCVDCHSPHSGKLKLPFEDNSLCMRCHASGEKINGVDAPKINMAEHTPCPQTSKGARCVECHMPESLYMARDPRRDHSFNSPDPALSVELGIPDACTMCHRDQTDEWAEKEVRLYYGELPKMARYRQRTRAVQWAYDRDERARGALLSVLKGEDNMPWQATLLALLEPWKGEEDISSVALKHLSSGEPMVRANSIRLLSDTPLYNHITPCLDDPVKLVRVEAARALSGGVPDGVGATRAGEELELVSRYMADQPMGALSMARMASAAGKPDEAEKWYAKALTWDATSPVVYRDYAVFLSNLGKTKEAYEILNKALPHAGQDAVVWYLHALASVEVQRYDEAIASFTKAVEIDLRLTRAFYNRGLLYNSMGKIDLALRDIQRCAALEPDNADYSYIMAAICFDAGRKKQAVTYAAEALRKNPGHEQARMLLRDASR